MNNNYIISELEKLRLPKIDAPIHKEQLRKHLINTYVAKQTKTNTIGRFKFFFAKLNIIKKFQTLPSYQKPLYLAENSIGFRGNYNINTNQISINADSTT